jgi:lysophospholipase L1-like esterase
MKWKKLILLGDSITQNGWSKQSMWAANLADLLQRKCDVINRGFSGYNSEKIRIILPSIFEEFDGESIAGVIIMLGSNDSTKLYKIQHVPVERYKSNMEYIVDFLILSGVHRHKIILISPPKKDDEAWAKAIQSYTPNEPSYHFDHLVKDYVKCVRKIAYEKDILFVDFNGIMEEVGGDKYKELLSDGLHLNEKGSDLLYEILKPLILECIANDLKEHFPNWTTLKKAQQKLINSKYVADEN